MERLIKLKKCARTLATRLLVCLALLPLSTLCGSEQTYCSNQGSPSKNSSDMRSNYEHIKLFTRRQGHSELSETMSVSYDGGMLVAGEKLLTVSEHEAQMQKLRTELLPPRCQAPGGKYLQFSGTNWSCVCNQDYYGDSCETGPLEVLFWEDFENGMSGWKGKGEKSTPESAIITFDSYAHGNVLQTQQLVPAGDAFSIAIVWCSVEEPCLVSFDYKGRVAQQFSEGYPDSLTASVMPYDNTECNGCNLEACNGCNQWCSGCHAASSPYASEWQHIEYVFPKILRHTGHLANPGVLSKIEEVHIVLQASSSDYPEANFDNILIRRWSSARRKI